MQQQFERIFFQNTTVQSSAMVVSLILISTVIHIILSPEAGATDIPLLLSGKTPPETSNNHGSQNYARTPVAIVVGGGFDDDAFNQMKEACKDVKGTVWVRAEKVEGAPPLSDAKGFGEMVAGRVKEKLGELKVGQDGGTTEGIFWF